MDHITPSLGRQLLIALRQMRPSGSLDIIDYQGDSEVINTLLHIFYEARPPWLQDAKDEFDQDLGLYSDHLYSFAEAEIRSLMVVSVNAFMADEFESSKADYGRES